MEPTFWSVFTRTVTLLRTRPYLKTFLLTCILPSVVLEVLNALLHRGTVGANIAQGSIDPVVVLEMLTLVLFQGYYNAFVTLDAYNTITNHEWTPGSIREVTIRKNVWIMSALPIVALVMVTVFRQVLVHKELLHAMGVTAIFLIAGVIFICIPVACWYLYRLLFVWIAMIIESESLGAAIERSLHMTKGRFWKLLGIGILFVMPVFLASLLISLIGNAIVSMPKDGMNLFSAAYDTNDPGILFVEMLSSIPSLLYQIAVPIALVILYLDFSRSVGDSYEIEMGTSLHPIQEQ